jgi:steroid 5-alpha reductase family enzyme
MALAGLLLVLGCATGVWVLSVRLRDASIADILWGPLFATLAWFYLIRVGASTGVRLALALLLLVWAARLATHIGLRHRQTGEDSRYRAMREARGAGFWWHSLFVVFWLQAVLAWFIAWPVLVVMADATASMTPLAWTGLAVSLLGAGMETLADWQLVRFKADPGSRGRVLDVGLWRYSRHPNYFGDAVFWWGVYGVACASPGGWLTLASPVLMTVLLLKVSGVVLLERSLTVSRPGYADYVRRTSAFVPWRPRRRA